MVQTLLKVDFSLAWALSKCWIFEASRKGWYVSCIVDEIAFTRPIDLWALPNDRLAAPITDQVEVNFFSRCEPKIRPSFLRERHSETFRSSPSGKVEGQWEDTNDETVMPPEAEPRPRRWWFRNGSNNHKATYDASLVRALHKTFFLRIWISGMLNLSAGVSGFFFVPFPN